MYGTLAYKALAMPASEYNCLLFSSHPNRNARAANIPDAPTSTISCIGLIAQPN